MRQDRRVYPPYRAGPAAEAGALEFDKIDLGLSLARACPTGGPADDGKRHCDLSRRWTLHYFPLRLGRCRRGVVGLHLRILRFS